MTPVSVVETSQKFLVAEGEEAEDPQDRALRQKEAGTAAAAAKLKEGVPAASGEKRTVFKDRAMVTVNNAEKVGDDKEEEGDGAQRNSCIWSLLWQKERLMQAGSEPRMLRTEGTRR